MKKLFEDVSLELTYFGADVIATSLNNGFDGELDEFAAEEQQSGGEDVYAS